jgi:phosphoribosylanthranilate isomerase
MVFAASPRHIALEDAAYLARPARGRARIVAVAVDPDDALVDRIAQILEPDLIQLHGDEPPARAREVAQRSGVGVIKAVGVAGPEDIAKARAFDSVVAHMMFDARAPAEANRPGGLGQSFDWSILAGLRLARPWFLAGGLNPWNVAEAVRVSGAPLVDVSSGVERGVGLKDPALISAFLNTVAHDGYQR